MTDQHHQGGNVDAALRKRQNASPQRPESKGFEPFDPIFGQKQDPHVDFDGFDRTMFPD